MQINVTDFSVDTKPVYPSTNTQHSIIIIDASVDSFEDIKEVIDIIGADTLLDNINVDEIIDHINNNNEMLGEFNLDYILKHHDSSVILETLLSNNSLSYDDLFNYLPQNYIDSQFREHTIDDLLDD